MVDTGAGREGHLGCGSETGSSGGVRVNWWLTFPGAAESGAVRMKEQGAGQTAMGQRTSNKRTPLGQGDLHDLALGYGG